MMDVRSILHLLALTDAITGLFYRKHVYYDKDLSWTDAQTYCTTNYVDLSIIDTQSEFENFKNQTVAHASASCWIGLSKNPNDNEFTLWTDGKAVNYTNWKRGQPDKVITDHCVFTSNNQWENENCDNAKKSFCYTWAPQMIVVQKMKTWEEALEHCRTSYTDLLSLNTETDHFLVNSISSEILTPTFWTGLHFMDGLWFWVNLGSPASLTSLPSCPARPYWCGARNIKTGVWENRDCEEKMNFICYLDIW